MANKLTFEIIVSDGGSAKLVQRGIENIGNAADRTAKKTRGAAEAQNELNYKLNQGTTGVSSAARSFSKLNQAIGEGPNGLVGAYATLAANAFAVSAAFNALREAAQVEQMMRGLEIQGGRTGLALKSVATNLQEITGFSISAADGMKTVALMSSAGFSTESMTKLTEVATNAAFALGRNVPDALDRISKGVTKLEPELLDELGIMTKLTEAQSRYALEKNKSANALTSFEKRQAMLNAVIAEGELKFGGLSEQVSANPFDKLAAAFSDLMRDSLSVINTIVGPLASIFSNKGMLLGAVILFGATIRKQLLPALYLMGKVSREMRDEHLKEAAAIRDTAKATLEKAKADKIASLESKKATLLAARTRALPRGFDLETAATGGLDEAALDKQRASLQRSINAREKNLRDSEIAWSNEKRALKQIEIDQIKAVQSALEDLYRTQNSGEDDLLQKRILSRKSNSEFYAQKKLAQAADLKAQAVEAASTGKLSDAWKQATESVDEYAKAVKLESRAARVNATGGIDKEGILGKALDATKIFGARAATFASIGAAAFMRFIPVVGVASTALSGAWKVYEDFIKSDAAKAHDAALRKLKQTLDETANSVSQFNRINNSSTAIGLRTAEAMVLQSNAAATIAGAFKEVQESQKDLARDSGKVDSFFEALIGGQDAMIAYQTGIGSGDEMFSAVEEAYGGDTARNVGVLIGAAIGGGVAGYFTGGFGAVIGAQFGAAIGGGLATWVQGVLPEELNGIDEAALESARAVSQLSKIVGEDVKNSMLEAAGGSEALAKSPALRAQFIESIGVAYLGVADAVRSLQEAFRQTGDALTKFFTDSIPTTPFDELVRGYTDVNRALRELDGTLAGSNIEEQTKLLSQMPAEMLRMLQPAEAAILSNISQQQQLLDANRDSMKELVDLGEDRTNSQDLLLGQLQEEKVALEDQMKILARTGVDVKESLKATEDTLRANQAQSRAYDAQLRLLNAIVSANSDLYARSVAGEEARIQRHNESIRLQQAQLQLQVSITETYIQQQEIAIQQLETKLELIAATKTLGIEEANNAQKSALQGREQAKLAATNLGVTQQQLQSIDKVVTTLTAEDRLTTSRVVVSTLNFATEEARVAAESYAVAAQGFAVANQMANTAIDIEERTNSIEDMRQSVSALKTQILAMDQASIDSGQAGVLLRQRAQELSKDVADRDNEILAISRDNLVVVDRTNSLLSARRNLIRENLIGVVATALTEKTAMREESGHNIAMLGLEKERIEAVKARLSTEPELKAAREAIDNLQKQIDQEIQLNALRQERQALNVQFNILEQIIGGGIEDNISRYQESLELRRQELDLANDLAEKQLEIVQNASRIDIARTGGTVSERTQQAFEIESAERAYKIALSQRELRMSAIDAEYDLIEFKKQADVQALKTQAYLLTAYNRIFNNNKADPVLNDLLNNIYAAASNLEQTSTSSMRGIAKEAVTAELNIAEQRVQLARATYQGAQVNRGAAAQAIANWAAEQQAIARANKIREEGIDAGSSRDTRPTTIGVQLENANAPVVEIMTKVQEELKTIREAIVPATETMVSSSGLNQTMTAEQMAKSLFEYTKSAYPELRVDEFGVTRGHGAGSMHYESRAFDVNAISGEDARNTQALNKLNRVARDLSERGMEVLWNGMIYQAGVAVAKIPTGQDPHTDHLHAEIDSAAYARMKTLYSTMSEASSQGASRASMDAANDNRSSSPATDTRQPPTQEAAALSDWLASSKAEWADYKLVMSEALNKELEGQESTIEVLKQKRNLFNEIITNIPGAMQTAMASMSEMSAALTANLGRDFGPGGQIMTALSGIMTTFAVEIPAAVGVLTTDFNTWLESQNEFVKGLDTNVQQGIKRAQDLSAAFSSAASIIGSIAGLLKSISDAKIAGIDREIAAEERRDGKSSASVAKMDALEKKKDNMARKSFNTQKKLMMAQAVMGTAAAVTSTLASMSAVALPPVPQIMAGIVGAMGLAQVGIISGMQFQSSYSPKTIETPSALSIGKRDNSVNLASGPNASAGGESAFLRGGSGTGTNASNFIGSAYGGNLMRGFGNTGFIVGEKGPEVITPETPINVTPANENNASAPVNATINIQAIDSQGVQDVLVSQKGNIIQMLRQAANANGQRFLEDVNVNVYTRPSVGKLL